MEAPNKNLIICPVYPVTWEIYISVTAYKISHVLFSLLVWFGFVLFWFLVECALKLFTRIEMRSKHVCRKERCLFKAVLLLWLSNIARGKTGSFRSTKTWHLPHGAKSVCEHDYLPVFLPRILLPKSGQAPYSAYALQVPSKMHKFGSQLRPPPVLYGRTAAVILSTCTLHVRSVLGVCSPWVGSCQPPKQLPGLGRRVAFARGSSWLLADPWSDMWVPLPWTKWDWAWFRHWPHLQNQLWFPLV